MYSTRWKACVPMSPMQPPGPLSAGSTRHPACFCPVCSIGWLSHPCRYSTATLRISPNSPLAHNALRIAHQRVACVGMRQRIRYALPSRQPSPTPALLHRSPSPAYRSLRESPLPAPPSPSADADNSASQLQRNRCRHCAASRRAASRRSSRTPAQDRCDTKQRLPAISPQNLRTLLQPVRSCRPVPRQCDAPVQ